MVDPSQPTHQSNTEMLAVPKELVLSIQEIIYLYKHHNQQNILDSLAKLILLAKKYEDIPLSKNLALPNYADDLEDESDDDFIKNWDDIFNVKVYIDTDIFGELDPRPPALVEIDIDNVSSNETVVQHTEATEIYVQAWKELAQSISALPEDLFTRLWTTAEIAKILECSPSSLRRSRRTGRLPIRIKDFILDCISHDGKRSLWFVRPS
ncbi:MULTISPECIES: hypothetical protein [Pseudanabaena]|uniref:Uncharacterized protein n=2 Tax=Pseudanabaena TaxID=1152 RepID=L8N0C9_9CYAN|nr:MULTISPECIES: hypothetical protein [Pseudanabaena]ELS32190.1 hypothetical protein Pse7429DRAFT_2714 [Pseudanabaena biceps PCC 7429]MDG3495560.1 hypothetical protein [Pseudanabaena catenata USMAC16]